jgi:alpha-tubulin suppressor-like RCC1 family protein
LKSDGTVWAWRQNQYGQLGDGTTGGYIDVPVRVSGLTDVTAIAGSPSSDASALRSDGIAWSWGVNDFGQVGDGQEDSSGADTSADRNTPAPVSGLTNVVRIAAGGATGFAVTSDGTAWAWGDDSHGQIGIGAAGPNVLVPTTISGLANVTEIAGGNDGGYALERNGTLWGWGVNDLGQLGTGVTGNESDVPVEADTPAPASAISATSHSAYAVITTASAPGS